MGLGGGGTFTVIGDDPIIDLAGYTQNENGILISQLNVDGIATIDVSGTAVLDGAWYVVDLGGAPEDKFNILTADGGISGAFDTFTLPDTDWSWGIDGGTTLWVKHVPEPATMLLLAMGGLAVLRKRRKQ